MTVRVPVRVSVRWRTSTSSVRVRVYCSEKISCVCTFTHTPIKRSPQRIPGKFHNYTSGFKREVHIEEARKVSSVKDITNDNLFLLIGGGPEPQNDFNEVMIHFMSSLNVAIEQLAEETGLSEKTIQRMRNDSKRTPAIESVVAVCIGLHLDPYDSDKLLASAGYTLNNKKIHRIYRLLIHFSYKDSVKDCNDALIRLGEKPLTGLHE